MGRTVVAADSGRLRTTSYGRGHDLRAIKVVMQRELIRFWQDRIRILVALGQPALFLFVLGTGLSSLTEQASGGVDLRTFLFPGVLAMSVQMPAIFSAASLVHDREFGFMREMLVAPVSRTAIVVGRCLGGAVVSSAQGMMVIALAPAVGIGYSARWIVPTVGIMLVLAFTVTSVGVLIASRIKTIPSFMAVANLIMMPMLFMSGAMFPLSGLPAWLRTLTQLNPLTYAVDAIRRTVFEQLTISQTARETLVPGASWGDWRIPVPVEVLLVLTIGLLVLVAAILQFRQSD